ncbi:MAG: hypothetical protein N2Z65_06830, partial [Clostridiales bacterium]|nr:hypothetical protein [Clostridiales bacterium]
MKRAISYILVLLMLISSMGISAIAADPSKANTAATSVTGSDKVGLSAAITAAKNKFSVPAEYKNFSYSVNDQGNEKVWQLNWSSVDGGSVNMSIDDAGRLRNYSRYDPTYNYSNKIKAPLITRTEAQKIAETTLSKVAPEISGHFKENTSNSYYYTGSYTYSFSYYRIENNIPLTSNTVSIEINFLTKQVTSLYVNWNYDLKFPAPEGAISLKDAQEILKKALHVSLEYRIQNDTGSDDAVKAVLVYNNVDGYKSVDPFTGKVYDQNYDWSNGKDDVSKMRGGMGGNTADSKIDGFTEEELQKISESEKLLTADDADKIIRTNKLLAIDDSYTLTSKSLNSAYRKTSDGNSSYLWYFYYTGKIVKNNFAAPSAYAAVDAKTGEILSFSSYNINDSSGKVSYNETSAKKIADQFLTANSGEKFKNTVKDDESPIIYPEYDSAKQPTSFSFYYARTYN